MGVASRCRRFSGDIETADRFRRNLPLLAAVFIIAAQARTAKKFLPLCKIAAAWIFQDLAET
jgi:hypothetical protein